jgi:nicotinate-nucleotide adenylyltransferase
MKGQRIGLLGGSFNPAHDGHRQISVTALKRLGLDAVWWIVSPANPLKTTGELAPLGERLAEARRVASHARIAVTSFETELPTAFTVGTLRFLRRRHPATRFVWLMGADNLVSVHRWQAWQDIFQLMPVAVLDRPGWRLRAAASKAAGLFRRSVLPEERAATLARRPAPAWTFITLPLSPHSSTEIRRQRRSARRSGEPVHSNGAAT